MLRPLAALFLSLGSLAAADVPNVATDIAPIHSITSSVMGDLGQPVLIVPQGADTHHFQLRPSQARAISNADLIIWMGEHMTPWMTGILHSTDRPHLELLELGNPPMRVEGTMANLVNNSAQYHADDLAEDHHDSTDAGHDHSHGELDPHAWLDPLNGAYYARAIAASLSELDPENAQTYTENADDLAKRLLALPDELIAQMQGRRNTLLIPFHDGYRYFYIRHNLRVRGAVADVHGAAPSAAHVSELRNRIAQTGRVCLFLEPGANAKLLTTLRPNGPDPSELYPLGSNLPLGPELYEASLRQLATTIAGCAQ